MWEPISERRSSLVDKVAAWSAPPTLTFSCLRGAPPNYAKSPVGQSIWTQLLVVQNGRHYNMLMECHFAQPGRGMNGSYEDGMKAQHQP